MMIRIAVLKWTRRKNKSCSSPSCMYVNPQLKVTGNELSRWNAKQKPVRHFNDLFKWCMQSSNKQHRPYFVFYSTSTTRNNYTDNNGDARKTLVAFERRYLFLPTWQAVKEEIRTLRSNFVNTYEKGVVVYL